MTTHDTVVSGGLVVTPKGVEKLDIGVRDGRISALDEPGKLSGHERIDASDLLVLPGLVDVHVHLRDPGYTHKEDFSSGTAEAAAGGVTTVIAQPNTDPPVTDAASLRFVRERGEGGEGLSQVDFGISGMCVPGEPGKIAEMAAEGAACVEILLADGPAVFAEDRDIREALVAAKESGLPACVYAVDSETAALFREGLGDRKDPEAQADSRPNVTEAAAILRVLLIAREAGTPVVFRQVSTKEAIGLLRMAKASGMAKVSGMPVGVEVNPQHLFLTRADLARLGPYAAVYPPLRTREDVEALWAAVLDGTVDWVGTDHAPHAPAEKEAGREDIFKAPGGLPGLRTSLPLFLNAVYRTRINLTRIVELLCTQPARRFGLGRKGEIRIGADADFVLTDPNLERTPKERPVYTKAEVTPYDRIPLKGWPVRTILGGETIAEEGEIHAAHSGKFVRPESA
jgi:dihydroorotase (multifunctional complex type)